MPFLQQAAPTAPRVIILLIRVVVLVKPRPPPPPHRLPGKPSELSDLARFRLASHLAVIMNDAMHSWTAQHAILSISLPVGDASSIMTGGDETLLVLFKFAIAPLSPQVRGVTLSTIANLLRSSRQKNSEFLQEQAKHAWAYLESCPLLPMALLDQYLLYNNNVAVEAARAGVLGSCLSTIFHSIGK
jgi:hypothetical protein